ncbi:response regulator transcription factor [Streptomyces sp. A1499]|nr:response regulator transcription factor [Streptomyces sp. A1499]
MSVCASDPISRAGALSQLRHHPEITFVDDSRQTPPQIALLLTGSVEESTLRSLRSFAETDVRVVLVVDRMRDADLLDVAECGVTSIVWRREATSRRLLRAVLAARRGEGDLPADLLGTVITHLGRLKGDTRGRAGAAPLGMTQREIEILQLVAEGLDTAEIADKLAYSERTVKNVLQHLTSRFQLRNRVHAVAYALRAGYI